MLEYWTNRLISESWHFLLALILLVAIFHLLLVWPKNISKRSWKKVDYIWLVIVTIGLLSLVSEVRVSTSENWLKFERSNILSTFRHTKIAIANPMASNMCMYGIEGDNPNGSKSHNDYLNACKWLNKVAGYLSNVKIETIPEIDKNEIPPVNFSATSLVEEAQWILDSLKQYRTNRQAYTRVESLSKKTFFEKEFSYFAPFLI